MNETGWTAAYLERTAEYEAAGLEFYAASLAADDEIAFRRRCAEQPVEIHLDGGLLVTDQNGAPVGVTVNYLHRATAADAAGRIPARFHNTKDTP